MTVQEARHCDECAHGAGEGHRRAVAAFLARRDELAVGTGVPAAVAHSPVASRQWVSDELSQSARTVADRGREAATAWLRRVWHGTLLALWGGIVALLLGQALTAVGAGWTPARTATLAAALLTVVPLTAAARAHRARGGLLAPLIGDDNRLSTSRAVAASWLLLAVFAVLLLALRLSTASGPAERDRLLAGLEPARGAALLTVLAVTGAVAVAVRRVVVVRILARRLQKIRAARPRGADLLCDDNGRASLTDVQYLAASTVALLYTAVLLGRRPGELPDPPWSLALLIGLSAVLYLVGKFTEGSRPVILSVVRAREAGDLDAAIRTGDDIEIRGSGFVPPGAATPDGLTRLVVRIGPVHTQVPLVPLPGGFANPTDTALTVPLPVDVEPGRVEVWVVTAAGVETNRVLIDVTE
ncbi:hypothetical protein ACH44C_22845 [Streptomyces purpureus]|uniref:hypothetical protein n=1 Tax=Streptomyces purpureus TaxID=1951 RepID=UPI0003790DE4|nr:hypothetical protein [Streptomyces purpureus]